MIDLPAMRVYNAESEPLVVTATVDVSPLLVSQATVSEVDLSLAGVEVPVSLPLSTKRFTLKASVGRIEIGFSNAFGSKRIHLAAGSPFEEGNLDPGSPVTLYLKPAKSGEVVSIISWS